MRSGRRVIRSENIFDVITWKKATDKDPVIAHGPKILDYYLQRSQDSHAYLTEPNNLLLLFAF